MIRLFHHYVSKMALVLLVLELGILLSATVLAGEWLPGGVHVGHVGGRYLFSLAFTLVVLFSMSALGMYRHSLRAGVRPTLMRLLPAFALGFALMHALLALRPDSYMGRAAIGLVFATGALGVTVTRLLVLRAAARMRLGARVLFIGQGRLARDCLAVAAAQPGFHGNGVVGCVAVEGEELCVPDALVFNPQETLLQLARRHGTTEIVVAVANRRGAAFPIGQLLECASRGLRVIDAATFFERETSQIRVDALQPSYLIYGGGFDQGQGRAWSKRLFDLGASALLLLVALPVLVVAAAAIALEDGGPVLYVQERVGREGRAFRVYKLRSMRRDAEAGGRPAWAAARDPRVTRVGRLVRSLRIDELPQLYNVLRGDMSLVGPRPERAFFVEQLARAVPYYEVRHRIKPGITGLAQVRYHYGSSQADAVQKLQYDLYYVKNNSLFLDLLILIDTVRVVLSGAGSR